MENINNSGSEQNSNARGVNESQPFFVEVRDGNGNPVRQMNFKNKEICPREGIIKLQVLKKTNRHISHNSFRRLYDRELQMEVGIPVSIDPKTKEWTYQRITLVGDETFDLRIEADAKRWAVVRRSHVLQGSPNLQGVPVYKVIDTEREAQLKLASLNEKSRSITVARGLYGEQLIDVARSIGIAPEHNSVSTLQVAVIEFAEKNHKEFLEIWDSPLRKQNFILKRAISLQVVDVDMHQGILYRGTPMGLTEPMAIQFLKENPNIAAAIDVLCLQKEDDTIKAMSKTDKPKVDDEKDVTIATMKAQMDLMAEQIKKMSSSRIEEDLAKEVDEIDPELAALKSEAKSLKVHGASLMGKDKLIKAIESAKSKA